MEAEELQLLGSDPVSHIFRLEISHRLWNRLQRTYIGTNHVVEPVHFDPAPASASQDGGSGSSSSIVVHNFLQ